MRKMEYGLNDTPILKKAIPLSLQHILTMLGATVAVPTIVASFFGLNGNDTAIFISNVLLAMGIATIIQVLLGTKLPIIQGSSFAFLPPIIYTSSIYPGVEGLQYMTGALLVGGLIQAFLGFSGLAGKLQKHLTPVVIGPTIMAIGLSLYSVAGDKISTNWTVAFITIVLIFIFSFGIKNTKQTNWLISSLSLYPIVFTIVVMWSICFALSLLGVVSEASSIYIGFPNWNDISLFKTEWILTWGMPKLNMSILFVFIISYLISTVESIGDYNAINDIVSEKKGNNSVNENITNRGVISEGLSCSLASILGSTPTTSYSENIGVIGITRVASRKVVVGSGIILMIAGAIPLFGNILASIPNPIMGGLYVILFGIIMGIGLRYAARADLTSMRNVSIIGFSLFFGLALSTALSSPDVEKEISSILTAGVRDIVFGIGKSSMAVTAISAFILDKVLQQEDNNE